MLTCPLSLITVRTCFLSIDNVNLFGSVLESFGIPYKMLPKRYGGPTALAQYKALISIPYQASTMVLQT